MASSMMTQASGFFTSDGTQKIIPLRSSFDWMRVYDYTSAGASSAAATLGCQYIWQRGMADGDGIVIFKPTGGTYPISMGTFATGGGFTLINTSDNTPVTPVSGTAITAATPAVATAASHGYVDNDMVRLTSITGMSQIAGIDFTVRRVNGNDFELAYLAAAGFAAPGATFTARKIPFNPIFYPRSRTITSVTTGTTTRVTMSVNHQFTVGQQVRFVVPPQFGMTELDGLQGTIVAVDTTLASNLNYIDVDIDSSSGFTAFAYPANATVKFSLPQVIPLGVDTAYAFNNSLNSLEDARTNRAVLAMVLGVSGTAGGITVPGPAGTTGHVMYWEGGIYDSTNSIQPLTIAQL